MITIPRSVARSCRAVFRRLLPGRSPRRSFQAVGLLAGSEGLRIRCAVGEAAVEYLHSSPAESARLSIPLDALAACEGRRGDAVVHSLSGGRVEVVCSEGGKSQAKPFACDGLSIPDFPVWSDAGAVNDPRLLAALERAMQTAAKEGGRFALHRVLLRGRKGEVAATDGSQLLIEGGFTFPWDGDVLVPRVNVFAAPELLAAKSVRVGRSGGYVLLGAGNWTTALKAAEGERFPNVEAAVPSSHSATVWRPGAGEAEALGRLLADLPGAKENLAPITIDLGRAVVLRAKAEGETRSTEVVLPQSTFQGRPVRFATNRTYLARACALGFPSLAVAGPGQPVVCRHGSRTYVWVTLDAKEALPPHPHPIRVSLDGAIQYTAEAAQATGTRPRVSGRPAPIAGVRSLLWFWAGPLRRLAGLVREHRQREKCG